MNKILLLAALTAISATAQSRFSGTTGDVALAAQTTTLTLQKPATNGKDVRLESITVACSAPCSFTQAYNGTAAGSTAGNALPIPPNTAAATATIWTASNVGGGVATGGIVHLYAPGLITIDASKVALAGAGTAANYSVTIASMTGTATITMIWSEL